MESIKEKEFKIPNYLLIIPIIIFFASRLLPFILYGPHPLGYDTGFYNYNIEKERAVIKEKGLLSSFTKMAEVESLGSRLITRALIALGFNNWMIMYFFYILAGALAGFLVYLFSKSYFGKTAAFFSALIYSVSFTQFSAYWEMFWKNAVGLFLMLLVFYLIEKGKIINYIISFVLIVLIFITHKTTAFILFASLLILFLFKEKKYRLPLVGLLILSSLPVIWLNFNLIIYLWEEITSGFTAHYDFFSVREGIFIGWPEFLKYSFFYLPLGFLTALYLLFKKKNNAALILFFVSLFFILIKFIFYRRLFVFLDIALIILAGFSFFKFFQKLSSALGQKLAVALMVVLFFTASFFFFLSITEKKPLVSREEIREMESIKKNMPQTKIFTYNSYYTPWLYGFSGHKIIAPGWGDLRWDLDDWNIFWQAEPERKKEMLKDFEAPLIIYAPDDFFSLNNECFKKIKDSFYFFSCPLDKINKK